MIHVHVISILHVCYKDYIMHACINWYIVYSRSIHVMTFLLDDERLLGGGWERGCSIARRFAYIIHVNVHSVHDVYVSTSTTSLLFL